MIEDGSDAGDEPYILFDTVWAALPLDNNVCSVSDAHTPEFFVLGNRVSVDSSEDNKSSDKQLNWVGNVAKNSSGVVCGSRAG